MRLILYFSILCWLNPAVLCQESANIKTDKGEGIVCSNYPEWKLMFRDMKFWTPTREQVLKAEEKVEEYLKSEDSKAPADLWRKLPKYKRQYVGIIVNGRKRIFCNFYCSDKALSCTPVVVLDGGDCFFHIEYEVESQKCINLEVNGNA